MRPFLLALQGAFPGFSGANPNGIFHMVNKQFTVSQISCMGFVKDDGNSLSQNVIDHDYFNLNFGNQVNRIGITSVGFFHASLGSAAHHIGYRHSFNARFIQGILDVIQF